MGKDLFVMFLLLFHHHHLKLVKRVIIRLPVVFCLPCVLILVLVLLVTQVPQLRLNLDKIVFIFLFEIWRIIGKILIVHFLLYTTKSISI